VPTLPAGFYANPDVVAALADYEFGRFFRIVRTDLRMTQEQFGLLVGLAQSRICKIENGVRLRDIESVARVASVLGTPPDLLGFTADAEVVDPPHRQQRSADIGAPTQQTRQRSSRS
jgi:transcriptional regulator with XRE-family HTH domain